MARFLVGLASECDTGGIALSALLRQMVLFACVLHQRPVRAKAFRSSLESMVCWHLAFGLSDMCIWPDVGCVGALGQGFGKSRFPRGDSSYSPLLCVGSYGAPCIYSKLSDCCWASVASSLDSMHLHQLMFGFQWPMPSGCGSGAGLRHRLCEAPRGYSKRSA